MSLVLNSQLNSIKWQHNTFFQKYQYNNTAISETGKSEKLFAKIEKNCKIDLSII